MDYGIAEGLNALNDAYGKKESRDRGLSLLEKMNQSEIMRRERNSKDQEKVAEYNNKVFEFADTLVEQDKQAVRDMAISMQERIQTEISKNGGDVSRFLANGGVSFMNKYKQDVIYSDEAINYKKNSENMAKIIKIRDAGKGHLLSKRDLAALESYELNGGGSISYSGMLSDIEMPDAKNFNEGELVPAEYILKNANNHQKIIANYMMEYPDVENPTNAQVLEYVREKYEMQGTKKTPKSTQRKGSTGKTPTSKEIEALKKSKSVSVLTQYNNMYKSFGQEGNINASELFADDFWGKQRSAKGLIGGKFEMYGDTDNKGWLYNSDGRKHTLHNARVAFPGLDPTKLMKGLHSGSFSQDGKMNFSTSMLYNSNGVKEDVSSARDVSGLTAVSVVTGFKGTDKNGQEMLVMGSDDKDYQKNIAEGFEDGSFKAGTYTVLKGEDGELFYMPIDTSNVTMANAVKGVMGELNDSYDYKKDNQNQAEQNALAEQGLNDQNKASYAGTSALVNDNDFSSELTTVMSTYALGKDRKALEAVVLGLSGVANPDKIGANTGLALLKQSINKIPGFKTVMQDNTMDFYEKMDYLRDIMNADLTDEDKIASNNAEIKRMEEFYNTLNS